MPALRIRNILLLTLFLPGIASPQGRITYLEPFDTNINRWWDSAEPGFQAQIADGRLLLTSQRDGWCSQTNRKAIPWKNSLNQYQTQEDFEIQAAFQWLEGHPAHSYGIAWGLRDFGASRPYWKLQLKADGRFAVTTEADDRWENKVPLRPSPAVRKGNAANEIRVKAPGRGNVTGDYEFLINGETAGKAPFSVLAGDLTALLVCGHQTVAVDWLSVTFTEKSVPAGWEARNEGSFGTYFEYGDPPAPPALNLAPGSKITLRRPLNGANLAVGVTSGPVSGAARWGVYLTNTQGARLRLEAAGGDKVVLSASAGGKDFGQRSVTVGGGTVRLRIERRGDEFRGLASAGGETREVGKITWPNLAASHEVGFFAEYPESAGSGPVKLSLKDLEASTN